MLLASSTLLSVLVSPDPSLPLLDLALAQLQAEVRWD